MKTDLDEKLAIVAKRMRHLAERDELFYFSWKQWETVVGRKGQAIKENFAKRYPTLYKAYQDYYDLRHIKSILESHPEWKDKLPEKIGFPK